MAHATKLDSMTLSCRLNFEELVKRGLRFTLGLSDPDFVQCGLGCRPHASEQVVDQVHTLAPSSAAAALHRTISGRYP